jgi:acylphosphatase
VQGVFFRSKTYDAAVREGITGWVKNLPDGRVEAVFEGDSSQVDRIIAWCRQGSPLSRIDHMEVQEESYQGNFIRFEIQYGR